MITRNVSRMFATLLAFVGMGAGLRPTVGGHTAPPDPRLAALPPARRSRRGAPAGEPTEHRAAIAALRTRPVGSAFPRGPVRNAAKRYRQGRGTWGDVVRAARAAGLT